MSGEDVKQVDHRGEGVSLVTAHPASVKMPGDGLTLDRIEGVQQIGANRGGPRAMAGCDRMTCQPPRPQCVMPARFAGACAAFPRFGTSAHH